MVTFYRKNKKKRLIRNILIVFLVVLGFTVVALYLISVRFYRTAMIDDRGHIVYKDKSKYSRYNIYKEDAESLEFAFNENDKNIEKWTTLNSNDLALVGYAHRQSYKTNKWVIVVHGYKRDSTTMTDYGNLFYEKGYNVFVIDNEYHGESEGKFITMGMHDSVNLVEWAWKLVNQEDDPEIILFGLSMGAATVMMASDPNLELPPNVKAVIEDCGYTSIGDIFSYQLKMDYGLPSFPIIPSVSLYNKVRNGYFFNDRSPLEAVSNTELPMLFIHGDADDYVPYYMGEELYAAHQGEKEYLIVEGAEHATAFEVNEKDYKDKVYNFIDKYIK